MLKSRYHTVFWGKTPWSLLHALLWRLKDREVLVIDDQSLSTASGGHRWLTDLEIGALLELGEKFQIGPLLALDSFLRPARLKVQTPQFQWVTCLNARDNLREFIRKFPVFQTPTLLQALDQQDIAADLRKVQKSFLDWFRSQQVRHRATPAFVAAGVPWFAEFQKVLADELTRPYREPADGALAQLVASYSCATGQVVKSTFAPHEAVYMATRLLSPVWELDARWFERELLRELQSQGAHFKRTGIQSWQMGEGRVEAALLDSYEGVIAYERLLMYGFPPATGALQCVFSEKVFRGLETFWPHTESGVLEEPRAELTCLTGARLMGTDVPMMLLEVGPRATRLQVLVEERAGAKPEFYFHEASEVARPFVRDALHRSPDWWESAKFGSAWDVWVEESELAVALKGPLALHEKRRIKIINRERQEELSGVQYWGPLMNQRFGVLGYLTELRWDLV
jgi:hypothetical protein